MARGSGAAAILRGTVVALGATLAGCNQTAGTVAPSEAPPRIAARAGVSPRGATVAIVDFDGGPGDIGTPLLQHVR